MLERFDQEYINDEVGQYSRVPVKIFVNAKAVRLEGSRKPAMNRGFTGALSPDKLVEESQLSA